MKKNITPETALKRSCTQLLKQFGGYSLPIPGGAYGTPGAPDRIVWYKKQVYAIEFKSPKGKLGPKQEQVKARIEAQGCKYCVIRSLEDFAAALNLPVLFGREP